MGWRACWTSEHGELENCLTFCDILLTWIEANTRESAGGLLWTLSCTADWTPGGLTPALVISHKRFAP